MIYRPDSCIFAAERSRRNHDGGRLENEIYGEKQLFLPTCVALKDDTTCSQDEQQYLHSQPFRAAVIYCSMSIFVACLVRTHCFDTLHIFTF